MEKIPVGYTFIKKEEDGTCTFKHIPSVHEYLPNLLEELTDFLEGCGFSIPGHLDIFEEE